MAGATAIVRITLANGCGHEDVGNAHMKDRDKGEVLSRVKKVRWCFPKDTINSSSLRVGPFTEGSC